MLLIPAIDLKDGQCVQLKQGVADSASIYSDDPAAMARRWIDAGARRIHVVDLDGAFAGEPVNTALVAAIVQAAGDVPVQLGGGIRTLDAVRSCLEMGVQQAILGTAAVENRELLSEAATTFPDRVILGIDAREGRAATRGWDATTGVDAYEFAGEVAGLPLYAIVFTDIARDGMLSGVNVAATQRMIAAASVPVVASGGVRSLDDLVALAPLREGLLGAISGSALYEGTLDFAAGQALLDASAKAPEG